MIYPYKSANIYYKVIGVGRPIVLLHGFLESSTIWERLVGKLRNTYSVVLIDLPGHGRSDVLGEIHSMELMAEVVHEILQQLNFSRATFLGHSMGGYVALAYLELFPSEIDTLILLNSTSAADSEERKSNRERALELIPKNFKMFVSMAISNLFAENSKKAYSKEIKAMQNEAMKFPIEGITATIRGMKERKDRTAVLTNFKGSKYIISAKEDPIIAVSEINDLAIATNSTLKIIDGGHISLIENYPEIENIMHFIE